jgi:hypothetical protein
LPFASERERFYDRASINQEFAIKSAPGQAASAKSKGLHYWAHQFASIKLAVVTILALGVLTAWGTIMEARYDSAIAQKLVYHSVYMYAIMAILSINLIAVMIDRWPWKERHVGFVCAHIGILILLAGSLVTRYFGVDGSVSLGLGESSASAVVSETDFVVYTSLDGERYTKIYDYSSAFGEEVDFFMHPPQKRPVVVPLPDGEIRVTDYVPFALRDEKILASEHKEDGPAVRFQLQNANVSFTDWILQPARTREAEKNLGPAKVILTTDADFKPPEGNIIVLRPKLAKRAGDEQMIEYRIYSKRLPGTVRKGFAKAGDVIETGWMGMVLRVLKYLPQAKQDIRFQSLERPTPLTTSAARISFTRTNGAPTEYWLALNSLVKLFTDQAVYVVTYANRRLDLGFALKLKNFDIGRYQGTTRAASYESLIDVLPAKAAMSMPGSVPAAALLSDIHISMNEPLKFSGYTFYQASFNEDENGRPVASVLSVNRDPGRWIKYLGALVIISGIIHMFYFKRRTARASKKPASTADGSKN